MNRQRVIAIAKKAALYLGAFVVMAALLVFLFRGSIFSWALGKVQSKLEARGLKLTYEKAGLQGLSTASFSGLTLVPLNQDTLMAVKQLQASVRIWPLITGRVLLSDLSIENGRVDLVKLDSNRCNYCSLLRSDGKKEEKKEAGSLARSAYRLIRRLLDQVPADLSIKQFSLNFIDTGTRYSLAVTTATLKNRDLDASVVVRSPGKEQHWKANGKLDADDMTGDLHFFGEKNTPVEIPLVDRKFNLKARFSDMNLKLRKVDMQGSQLVVEGYADINGLRVNQPRLSDQDVVIEKGSGDFRFLLGSDFVALDSSSTIILNKLKLHPYARYQRSPWKEYELKLFSEKASAQDVLNSLPEGMFSLARTMKMSGSLSYRMHLLLDDRDPYAVQFSSNLMPEKLAITDYGECRLTKINGSFSYTFYDNGAPVRTFTVGPENPNYVSLDAVSPYLKDAVLTSEDPSFFGHRGFITESIRQSIAQNYVARRFKRGGSTITMQLVKNVFLSRKKTLARKFEEILLVWMIENMGISSKSRMYEVYLNLIEWGPGVFGAGEASGYYFGKHASQLGLQESIYLASIIPRPKSFRWFFDSAATVKPQYAGYFNRIKGLMFRRGLISDADTSTFVPLQLTGPARNSVIRQRDTALIPVLPGSDEEELD